MPLEEARNLDLFDLTASWISQMTLPLNFTFMRISFVPELSLFFILVIASTSWRVSLSHLICLKI